MLSCLSLDIICSSKFTVSLLGRTDNVRGQLFELIFSPNGGYCLFIRVELRAILNSGPSSCPKCNLACKVEILICAKNSFLTEANISKSDTVTLVF